MDKYRQAARVLIERVLAAQNGEELDERQIPGSANGVLRYMSDEVDNILDRTQTLLGDLWTAYHLTRGKPHIGGVLDAIPELNEVDALYDEAEDMVGELHSNVKQMRTLLGDAMRNL